MRIQRQNLAVALTIAGSDSGGGAGIQADLKTFASLGVHGTSAITCLTAQNPKGVRAIHPCPPEMVRQQILAVWTELRPGAVKTGMLYSAGIIRAVAGFFRSAHSPPLIVDPVMVSGSGSRLMKTSAGEALERELIPRATLVTPNLAEAQILGGGRVRSIEDMRRAAREIHGRFGCAALIKGGHLPNAREAADILFDGKDEWLLTAPFTKGLKTHGTGCTYSAAITAHLALGASLPQAVAGAKEYISGAIAGSQSAAGHAVLNSFWALSASGHREDRRKNPGHRR